MLDADMVSPAGRAILDRASELQGQGVPASQQVEALLQLYEAYGLADMARRQLAAADSEERTHA